MQYIKSAIYLNCNILHNTVDRRDAAGCTGVQRSSVSVGAGRLMIVAGEGGRERVEGKVWKGGKGGGGGVGWHN